MSGWLVAAYAGYLAWLLAGFTDFACHRRTDLPHTSGLAESVLHIVQLSLLGLGICLALAFEIDTPVLAALCLLVAIHATVGYLDTKVAWPRRDIRPAEQHVHSVLDMAPIVALAAVIALNLYAITGPAWRLRLREPALPLSAWALVLGPALVLCWLPALVELRAAWRAARRGAAAAAPPSGAAAAHPTALR